MCRRTPAEAWGREGGDLQLLRLTHICGRSRERGYFTIYRRTTGKRMAAKRKDIRRTLRQRMHAPVADTAAWLRAAVRGYFQYHAVPDNEARLRAFRTTCSAYGCISFDGGVNAAVGRGSVSWSGSAPLCRRWKSCTLGLRSGSPPGIQGKNRVREQRQHGSVRGVSGNWHP